MDHTVFFPKLDQVVCLQEPTGKGGVGPLKPSWAHCQFLAQHPSCGPGKALFTHWGCTSTGPSSASCSPYLSLACALQSGKHYLLLPSLPFAH